MEHSGKKKMNNTILIVAAHPDDEALGCGATILKHTKNGDKVQIVFLSDGFKSRDNDDNRDSSAEEVSKTLGCETPIFFNFPDNQLDTVSLLEVVKKIEKIIDEYKPNIVYTHHSGDLNIDHRIAHKAVVTACRPQPDFCVKEIYAFEVLSSTEWQTHGINPFCPNTFVDVTEYMDIKKQVLEIYSKEMHQPPHSRSIENALRLNALRGNFVGIDYAESFQVVRVIR
jgi:LmbE family N-acetylglucosaminyl deacetylase